MSTRQTIDDGKKQINKLNESKNKVIKTTEQQRNDFREIAVRFDGIGDSLKNIAKAIKKALDSS